jgi:hypothetical protein
MERAKWRALMKKAGASLPAPLPPLGYFNKMMFDFLTSQSAGIRCQHRKVWR